MGRYLKFVTHHTPHKYTHMQVLKRSQYLLLQTASPDALVQLKHSPLSDQREELLRVYFQQHHGSLEDFLVHHLQMNGTQGESLLMQVHSDHGRAGGGEGRLRSSCPSSYTSNLKILLYHEMIATNINLTTSRSQHTATSSHMMNLLVLPMPFSWTSPTSMHIPCKNLTQNLISPAE